jgi:outer membrane protein TolC
MKRGFVVGILPAVLGAVLLAASATPALAQADRSDAAALDLTLEDAVRRAMENNPDVAVVKLGTEVSAARVGESLGAYAPVFSTTFARTSNTTPPSTAFVGDSGVDVKDLFSSTGVRQRLRWGSGTWSVSWDTSRTTSNSPFNSFDPSLQSGVQVAFSQPLLRDREIDSSRQQYIIAKRNQQSSELSFRESVVQTAAAVKQAYWTLKATLANVTVQQRSLELAEELARQNKIRVDAGQIPPLDLVQAEAEVAQRREGLIQARTAAEDAEDRLRRFIMDPADASFWQRRLNPIDDPAGKLPLPDVNAAVASAMSARYDIVRAGNDLENVKTNVAYLNNQRLPDVRFETLYRGSGLAGRQFVRTGGFPGVITGTLSRSFGDALGQAFTPDYPTWSFGVTVNYPLGHSYEEASLARADIERRQTEQRIASLRLQAAETIRQSARQIQSNGERVDAAQAGASLARQRLDSEQRRFEVGLSTTFLVTQAQRDLLQSEVNLLQTTLDYQSALVNFEAVQLAPPLGASNSSVGLQGASVVVVPPSTPRGLFRQGASAF